MLTVVELNWHVDYTILPPADRESASGYPTHRTKGGAATSRLSSRSPVKWIGQRGRLIHGSSATVFLASWLRPACAPRPRPRAMTSRGQKKWNARLAAGREAWSSPSIHAALVLAGCLLLRLPYRSCNRYPHHGPPSAGLGWRPGSGAPVVRAGCTDGEAAGMTGPTVTLPSSGLPAGSKPSRSRSTAS